MPFAITMCRPAAVHGAWGLGLSEGEGAVVRTARRVAGSWPEASVMSWDCVTCTDGVLRGGLASGSDS